jgi:hypothetical protein
MIYFYANIDFLLYCSAYFGLFKEEQKLTIINNLAPKTLHMLRLLATIQTVGIHNTDLKVYFPSIVRLNREGSGREFFKRMFEAQS